MTKSQHQRAENELIFKQRNDKSSRLAKEVLDEADRRTFEVNFVCECSNEHCTEIVELTLPMYEQVRHHPAQFVIRPGHEQTDIEEVVHTDGYSVVQKFEPVSVTDGRLNPSKIK